MAVFAETTDRAIMITIDRPPLNVLDIALLHELGEVLTSCAQEQSVDVVVLKGGGERAFSAGVDVKDHTMDKVPEMLEVVHGVMRKLLALPQVTVALVRGACLGGGCELASCCDFILAAEGSHLRLRRFTSVVIRRSRWRAFRLSSVTTARRK